MRDYLKYWRVVRYFITAKYDLKPADLDMLLFLSSEKYFAKADFDEFNQLMSWDKNRFEDLKQKGWIEVFRRKTRLKRTIYQLTFKAKRMVSLVYDKLEGQEIPESPSTNPMFLKNVSYSDKVYRNYIKEMNKFIRQQRHLSQK
jgi:hypothetical protein